MRTTFSNHAEVCHIWASQSQASGSAGRVYFRGDTIFSYGDHFPMARIVTRPGHRFVLLTSRSYSSSTAKHKTLARDAVQHLRSIEVEDVYAGTQRAAGGHKMNLAYFRARIDRLLLKAARARHRADSYVAEARRVALNANCYCQVYGLKSHFTIDDVAARIAQAKKRDAAATQRERARLARERARLEAHRQAEFTRTADHLARWLAGEAVDLGPFFSVRPDLNRFGYLRLHGSRIETSGRAVVNVEDAKPLLPLIRAEREQDFTSPSLRADSLPPRIGSYTVDLITADGTVHAGCHKVPRAEIERIATQLGL